MKVSELAEHMRKFCNLPEGTSLEIIGSEFFRLCEENPSEAEAFAEALPGWSERARSFDRLMAEGKLDSAFAKLGPSWVPTADEKAEAQQNVKDDEYLQKLDREM